MKSSVWILPVLSMVFAAACAVDQAPDPGEDDVAAAPDPLTVQFGLAMRIASSGHGKVFDAKGQPIAFSLSLIEQMNSSIKAEVLQAISPTMSTQTAALLKEVNTWLAKEPLTGVDRRMLDGALTWRLLQDAPAKLKLQYEWRVEVLNYQINPKYQPGNWIVNTRLRDLLRRLGYLDLSRFLQTDYMKRCSEQGVPIPPNWAESGTAWQLQGDLTSNLLAPGEDAHVWTYEDPAKRGACIALPRGSGLAGIICQSATTGAACFWDNILRDPVPGETRDWRGRTLEINRLLDGTNHSENCTGCHRGNNVYLISPDDPTWRKVLKDLPHAAGSRFTTHVERSTDNRGGHPRYVPITTTVPRPDWINPYSSVAACSGSCHEAPPAIRVPSPMPPACASSTGGCY